MGSLEQPEDLEIRLPASAVGSMSSARGRSDSPNPSTSVSAPRGSRQASIEAAVYKLWPPESSIRVPVAQPKPSDRIAGTAAPMSSASPTRPSAIAAAIIWLT